jgi:vanillate/3-O-methylgallate O-demethylase
MPGSGDGMLADYRDWLGADSYEAAGAIGGSYVSKNIEDYYVNPFELGYDFYIGWKKDDFVGKAALEKMKGANNRKKVTFEWNADDVINVIASAFRPGEDHFKWIDFPQPNYASSSADMVLNEAGKMVGMSMFNGYSYNERTMLSLGVVNSDVQVNDILTLKWGEPEQTGKTSTEQHKQAEIRVRVAETPYAAEARENYTDSWRTKSKV